MAAFGTMPTQRVLFIVLLFCFGVYTVIGSQISDLRTCADKSCSVTLSRATVLARYPASSPLHLSLNRGDIVEVKSKSAGNRPEFWGGEVNGRRGYFPKAFVKEFDVHIHKPLFEVSTEENVWSKQPHPPSQQKEQKQMQEKPLPPEADVVKDETEIIDETDLTDAEEPAAGSLPQEDLPKSEVDNSQPADAVAKQAAEGAAETKEDKKAEMKDPLLQDLEDLQKSYMMMDEVNQVLQDPQVFNDFLAKQFGGEDAAVASAPDQLNTEADKTESEQRSAQNPDTGVPTVAPNVDETDLDSHDAQTIPAAKDEKEGKVESETEEKETPKAEDSSPYINGVREMEDEEEETETEAKDDPQETTQEFERKITMEDKHTEEKTDKIVDDINRKIEKMGDENQANEDKQAEDEKKSTAKSNGEEALEKVDRNEVPVEDPTEVGGEDIHADEMKMQREKQVESKEERSEDSSVPLADDKLDKAPPVQDAVVEPDHDPSEQNVVKQVIEENGQEQKETVHRAGQDLHGEAKPDPENDIVADKAIHSDKLVQSDPVAGNTGANVEDDIGQQNENNDNLMNEKSEETEYNGEYEEMEENDQPQIYKDALDSFTESSPEEGEEASDGTAGILGEPELADQGDSEKEMSGIHPDKTVSESAAPSADHQPVDIDFVAGQVRGSDITLDSSQTVAEQQLPASTPTLEDSPSLQQITQTMSDSVPPVKTKAEQPVPSVSEDQAQTTIIDGTTFTLEDGEPVDIVPGSVPKQTISEHVIATEDLEMSSPPVHAIPDEHIQPTATSVAAESLSQQDLPSTPAPFTAHSAETAAHDQQQIQNKTEETTAGSVADQHDVSDKLTREGSPERYQTTADFLSRKVLSVNTQVPQQKAEAPEQIPAQQKDNMQTEEQQSNTQGQKMASETDSSNAYSQSQKTSSETASSSEVPVSDSVGKYETRTSENQPSVSSDAGSASVTIEGEEQLDQSAGEVSQGEIIDEKQASAVEDSASATTPDTPQMDEVPTTPQPVQEDETKHLSSEEDVKQEQSAESTKPEVVQEDAQKTSPNEETAGKPESTTAAPPDASAEDNEPPPYTANVDEPAKQIDDEPTVEGDPYQMDDFYSRKINDEELSKAEAEAEAYTSGSSGSSVAGSLEAQSRAFIDKLPPSIQSLLEQEPLGLSPVMTVLVTVTALTIFVSITCFSCLCSSGGKKAGTKDPLVVVRELEEKLLMAVKEKENLEDLIQERQAESKKMKSEVTELQSKSGSMTTDLQNVTLHNEVLKNQITSLQTEVSELKSQLSRKSDDVKVKDKKTKDIEKETKKLQEAKQKLEQAAQKKEQELQRIEDENQNLKISVQSLTDQVQLLDTSKQQLLTEAEDWKEKVDELKERVDQMEQENRQAQETISFKDNELEIMKDCYLQLKSFEKGEGEGEEEEYDTGSSKDVQEKIQAMMDVSKVNATLRAVQEEKDNLDNRLKIENDARRELEEQLECVRREMESSMADKMKAERQCQEAQTKLSVLSSYFKDKELQLQRELGEQEALKKQNLSKLDSADENTRTLQKELELSKQQVESLKRELTASERDFRAQIAANEKKAHENWLNARAAERELKETRHEAAVLRQKLTETERRQMDLIRPLPTRGMPPPGMLNGPPPPGMERSPSRGSMPPGAVPPGPHPPPPFREGEFPLTPRERERLPPSHPARHMPPPEARSPPPRMLPPDVRGSPPRMLPPEARSPPPYDRRGPPHPMDSRTPPMRLPPPDMVPPMRGPPPPRMGHPPMGSPGPRMDSPRDPRQGPPYGRPPPPGGDSRRQQSQV